jgi:tRNA-splicing ligase RtcB
LLKEKVIVAPKIIFGARERGRTSRWQAFRACHKIANHYTKLAGGKNGIDVEPAVLGAGSDIGREYLIAMDLAGRYAYAGREWVVHTIVRDFMHASIMDAVHNHHNFAWKEIVGGADRYVVRKGATPLYPGQRGFVGGSMGDISVILKGRDDGMPTDFLNSTIHGSGRVMSRTQAAGKSRWAKGRKISLGGGLVDEQAWRETITERGIILVGAGADEMPPVYRAAAGGARSLMRARLKSSRFCCPGSS